MVETTLVVGAEVARRRAEAAQVRAEVTLVVLEAATTAVGVEEDATFSTISVNQLMLMRSCVLVLLLLTISSSSSSRPLTIVVRVARVRECRSLMGRMTPMENTT